MSIKICGRAIADFTIVIPEKFLMSEYRIAIYLKQRIQNMYATRIDVRTDEADYGAEILIGNTKRTTADAPTGANSFNVVAKDGKLQVRATSMFAYDALNDYLMEKVFLPGIYEVSNEYFYEKDITDTLEGCQEYTMKRDASMRVMMYNMWGNSTIGHGPRDQHQMLSAEVVNAYKPDVIGFQEFNDCNRNDGWWSTDALLRGYGYKEVIEFEYTRKFINDKGEKCEIRISNDGTRVTNNFTPIFYNPEKVTLVEADFVPYGERDEEGYHLLDSGRANPFSNYYYMHNDYFSKSLTWAVFKDNATGKKFGYISTHFWYAGGPDGNAARVTNAKLVMEQVEKITAKYPGISMFVGGDLNCNVYSDPYKVLIDGGLVDVQTLAEKADGRRTFHAYPTYNPKFVEGVKYTEIDAKIKDNTESNNSVKEHIRDGYIGMWTAWKPVVGNYDSGIDHILVHDPDKNFDLKLFQIVANKMALLTSDHCPLICDFNLK